MLVALTRVLKVDLEVAYLNGRTNNSDAGKGKGRASNTVEVDIVKFDNEEEGVAPIRLLYR